ncbi:YunG family protein [Bacillus badius]|uniref:YunG family protein n=2 Tax=Bacillus badius TaxID=1455 RepID=UPI000596EEC4
MLGGDIVKTRMKDGGAFYNWMNGRRDDLTRKPFFSPIHYEDIISNREEACQDTNDSPYRYLQSNVHWFMNKQQ